MEVNPGKVIIMVAGWGDEKFDVLNSTSTSFQYSKIVHAFLVDSNEKVELIPGIASDWGISSDGLTWTFTIRKGVKFHDGTDLTAEDVLWTWQHLFGPEALEITTSGTITNMIHKTEKIEHTEPDAVSLSTSLPEAPFPFSVSRISPNWMGMMPKRDKPQDEEAMLAYNRDPIATGFMKLVRHVPAEVMEFERFDDYYYQPKHGLPQDRRVKFTFLDMRLVPEEATRVAAMRAGETDIAPVSLGSRKQVEAEGGRLVFGQEGSYFRVSMYGCWVDAELEFPGFPCQDKRVRQALDYAIDKELMRDTLFGGPDVMVVKGWGIVNPSTIGYSPELDPYPFDPDKARRLLAEAGYKTPTNPEGKDFGQLIVNTWVASATALVPESAQLAADFWRRELGLDVEVRVSEEVAIKKARKGGEMHRRGQIVWRDDDSGADAILVLGSGYGPHRKDRFHNDPEIFALFEEASQVFDPAERQKVLNDLYLRLRDEHYQLGIGYYNIIWATGPRISTWRPNPIALYPSALHTLTLK